MTAVTATDARAALPELLTRVEDGEEIIITRHGRPVAVLVRPDTLRSRRGRALMDLTAQVHDLLAEAAVGPAELPEQSELTAQRAEELISEIRAGRDSH